MKKGQLNPKNIEKLKIFLESYKLHKKLHYDLEYLLAKFSIQEGLRLDKVRAYYREAYKNI